MNGADTKSPVLRLIDHAVMAGAYRELARREPTASRGLLKMAEKHSAIVAEITNEVRDDGDSACS